MIYNDDSTEGRENSADFPSDDCGGSPIRGYRVYSRNAVGLEKCVNFEAYSAADAVTQAEIRDRGTFPKWRVFGVEPMS